MLSSPFSSRLLKGFSRSSEPLTASPSRGDKENALSQSAELPGNVMSLQFQSRVLSDTKAALSAAFAVNQVEWPSKQASAQAPLHHVPAGIASVLSDFEYALPTVTAANRQLLSHLSALQQASRALSGLTAASWSASQSFVDFRCGSKGPAATTLGVSPAGQRGSISAKPDTIQADLEGATDKLFKMTDKDANISYSLLSELAEFDALLSEVAKAVSERKEAFAQFDQHRDSLLQLFLALEKLLVKGQLESKRTVQKMTALEQQVKYAQAIYETRRSAASRKLEDAALKHTEVQRLVYRWKTKNLPFAFADFAHMLLPVRTDAAGPVETTECATQTEPECPAPAPAAPPVEPAQAPESAADVSIPLAPPVLDVPPAPSAPVEAAVPSRKGSVGSPSLGPVEPSEELKHTLIEEVKLRQLLRADSAHDVNGQAPPTVKPAPVPAVPTVDVSGLCVPSAPLPSAASRMAQQLLSPAASRARPSADFSDDVTAFLAHANSTLQQLGMDAVAPPPLLSKASQL